MMKKIRYLRVDQVGCINSLDGEIDTFLVNGEMAHVKWFRQGNSEFNGKYVVEIGYEDINDIAAQIVKGG
jgi:hypothetical protein